MSALEQLLEDLTEESVELDNFVSALPVDQWKTVTTPEGWTVAHQIGHLCWTDEMSIKAMTDPQGFVDHFANMTPMEADRQVDVIAAEFAELPVAQLLERWRTSRAQEVDELRSVPTGKKIVWAGPPMSATSMATARLMETWAHSLDVYDAFRAEKPISDRVRHVCHIGVRTRGYVHINRGETAPEVEIRVELESPSGDVWTWGSSDAEERVSGPAWDFALLATRRRHRRDVNLIAEGEHADHWLGIVQTFAGQPGNDPLPLADRTSR